MFKEIRKQVTIFIKHIMVLMAVTVGASRFLPPKAIDQ